MRIRLLSLIAATLVVAFVFALDRDTNARSGADAVALRGGQGSEAAKTQRRTAPIGVAQASELGRRRARVAPRTGSPASARPDRPRAPSAAASPVLDPNATDAGAAPVPQVVYDSPYFDRISPEPGHVTVGITGVDPAGERSLVLWELGGVPRPLATANSDDRGRFDFGQRIVPVRGIRLAVAPAGTGPPGEASSSAPSTLFLSLSVAADE